MKKVFMIFALCAAVATANAQVTVTGSKFLDNWSVGIDGGVLTPTTHHAFFGSMRPTAGLTIAKQLTPIFGLGVEGRAAFNTSKLFLGSKSNTVVDMSNVSILGLVNLNNLFSGYKGTPRPIEVVAVYGLGWGHGFFDHRPDFNCVSSKAGLDFNFNFGKDYAWQFNLKPAIAWNIDGDYDELSNPRYSVNQSGVELSAGITYKFKNSNGSHNFTIAKLFDQAQIDGLNAKINDLRSTINSKDNELTNDKQTIKSLQDQLNDARNKQPQVVTKNTTNSNLESVVTFAQGKSNIEKSQLPNVERIATYMKSHKNSRVSVKGYASPEGSAAINAKIAKARAEAVKSILVNKYKIAASRIDATGQGVGNMFSEPDWNRVSISTLEE